MWRALTMVSLRVYFFFHILLHCKSNISIQTVEPLNEGHFGTKCKLKHLSFVERSLLLRGCIDYLSFMSLNLGANVLSLIERFLHCVLYLEGLLVKFCSTEPMTDEVHVEHLYLLTVDINECKLGTHNCGPRGTCTCINTVGSFKCRCRKGYRWDGQRCQSKYK